MKPKNNEENKLKSLSSILSVGKDLFSLLRDLSLFTLAFLLILLPTQFNQILTAAGFEEGSFVGFKWKKQLVKTESNLNESIATINDLKQKNDELAKALNEAQKQINNPALQKRINELEASNKLLRAAVQRVQDSAKKTINENTSFIDKASSSISFNEWGVVYGADSTLESAKYEITTVAQKNNIPNPQIYFRNGSYRSVSVANSRDDAKLILPKAKKIRNDSYIVNMSQWCPNPIDQNNYFQCK